MKRALAPMLLIALALMLRSACNDRLSVEGMVLDTEGQPVVGAVVTARYPRKMREETKSVQVEDDGTFRLSLSVPPSKMPVPLSVRAPGFEGTYMGAERNQHLWLEAVLAPSGSDARSSFTLEAR